MVWPFSALANRRLERQCLDEIIEAAQLHREVHFGRIGYEARYMGLPKTFWLHHALMDLKKSNKEYNIEIIISPVDVEEKAPYGYARLGVTHNSEYQNLKNLQKQTITQLEAAGLLEKDNTEEQLRQIQRDRESRLDKRREEWESIPMEEWELKNNANGGICISCKGEGVYSEIVGQSDWFEGEMQYNECGICHGFGKIDSETLRQHHYPGDSWTGLECMWDRKRLNHDFQSRRNAQLETLAQTYPVLLEPIPWLQVYAKIVPKVGE